MKPNSDMFCQRAVIVPLCWRFLSVLLSLHNNESIRLWFWWSLPVSEACVVWVNRHAAISEEWNILITARPIPANVTLHTHSYCSIEPLYVGIAHSLILKRRWTKDWGNSCAQACAQTHTQPKQTHTFTWKQLLYVKRGQTHRHTHRLSRMQEKQ